MESGFHLGVMSGSSLDGLDLAFCKFEIESDQISWRLLNSWTRDIPIHLLKQLSRATSLSGHELHKLESDYTMWLSEVISDLELDKDVVVSVHGHTVFHYPDEGFSKQLCNGGLLSSAIGRMVICDFRNGDIGLGGVGTPLVPIAEKFLFKGFDYYLNLGGIANLTISKAGFTAFDVVPCNQLLNHVAQKAGHPYDRNGKMARAGKSLPQFMDNFDFEYFSLLPPKSIDNSWIKESFLPILDSLDASNEDILASLCDFISSHISLYCIEKGDLMVTGGGAHNTFLLKRLKENLKVNQVNLVLPEIKIIDYKEAILMAFMGFLRGHALPNVISSVTGATLDVSGGGIYQSSATGLLSKRD